MDQYFFFSSVGEKVWGRERLRERDGREREKTILDRSGSSLLHHTPMRQHGNNFCIRDNDPQLSIIDFFLTGTFNFAIGDCDCLLLQL